MRWLPTNNRLLFIDEFVKNAEGRILILIGGTGEREYSMVFGKILKLFSLQDLAVE
jgi:hypothetical protein